MKLLYTSTTASPADPIGGKAAALAALGAAGFPVPAWIVLSPAAFESVGARGESRGAARLSAAALRVLEPALRALCPGGEFVAVRTSAAAEDGALHSHAGQLESFLSVRLDDVPARAADVWASAFAPAVRRYREERGLGADVPPPAVLVQRMVDAEVAGVAFSADPVSGRRDEVVVSAVRGLADRLVAGEVEGETLRIDARGRMRRASADSPVVSDTRARGIAALARRAEAHRGCPQDVEWAVTAEDELFLLQSRPITTLRPGSSDEAGVREGAFAIWDNSNIVESYNGVTGPLTFTFARGAYEGVYRQFCRILSVSPAVIRENDATFKGMLGWIQGRVYYNLLNWYRVLAMLPGYQVNRGFMEQMMGVEEGLPDDVADEIASSNTTGRVADGARALVGVGGLVAQLFGLRRATCRFRRRLEAALRSGARPLEEMSPQELAAHYRELEARLLTRWDAPLLNDFFCMIFYGILSRLDDAWCGGSRLHDELLQQSGGMISAEPARCLRKLASLASRDPALRDALATAPLEELEPLIERASAFRAAYEDYLELFGERCVEELKLETPTLHDDPLPLLRAIGQCADGGGADAGARPPTGDAAARLEATLGGRPLRRTVFRAVLRQAQTRIRERENLRFERTRVFGRVRRIFVELGRRLHASGLLREPRDVFFLEVERVLAAAESPASGRDLQEQADAARRADRRWRALPAPPSRFETWGAHPQAPAPVETRGAVATTYGEHARGLGCSPGVVRGRVRVVSDPRKAGLSRGEILVARSTDPGWVLLFPLAAGLVVERGSPLSHSAIVARELGIPAVVSLKAATDWLRDGDEVELDGTGGTVTRVGKADGA